jgi:membrane fusion protein (multidrug efflux system)
MSANGNGSGMARESGTGARMASGPVTGLNRRESEDGLTAEGRRPPRGRRAFFVLGAAVVLVAGVFAVRAALQRGEETTDNAQVESDVVPIAARVAGTVTRVLVADDQAVQAGQLIAELDRGDWEPRSRQAQADVEAARAQLAAADAQVAIVGASSRSDLTGAQAQLSGSSLSVQTANAQTAAAEAALARARAEAQRADADFARSERLQAAQALTRQQFEAAQAARDVARSAVAQAEAQLAGSREQAEGAQARVAEARARVVHSSPVEAHRAAAQAAVDLARARLAQAEAAAEQASRMLSYTRIEAPAAGTVARLAVHPGQTVQGGQKVVDFVPGATYVVANFKETQIGQMRPGQRAEVKIDALGGPAFEAQVVGLSPATGARFSLLPPDNASGNFVKVVQRVPVKLAWSRPPGVPLAAGLSAEVTVHTR